MPDHLGDDMRKIKEDVGEEKEIKGMNRKFTYFQSSRLTFLYPL